MEGTYFHFEKFLGKGSFGSVSLFKFNGRHDGKTRCVAVKTSDGKHAEALYREFRILSEFRGSSGIVQCYGTRVHKSLNDEGHREYKIPMEYA
ncbi:unnamed protein product [Microthlaspi erraticum]|uniref:Protein kinase domain-containing protein n=1 Tax=Microthlaspi erraticum TaxID=1685480 RepID=A0A6D2JMY8_9BRAS|nr:unnamed protein product [Microthlaspi erraticum]